MPGQAHALALYEVVSPAVPTGRYALANFAHLLFGARPGAQKFVPKLSGPRLVLHWQKARQSVQKPCAERAGSADT